jgi:hypothetical protein
MSAFGGKADVPGTALKSLLIATNRLTPLLEKHPDKTFIGWIERGFDFLGYRPGG